MLTALLAEGCHVLCSVFCARHTGAVTAGSVFHVQGRVPAGTCLSKPPLALAAEYLRVAPESKSLCDDIMCCSLHMILHFAELEGRKGMIVLSLKLSRNSVPAVLTVTMHLLNSCESVSDSTVTSAAV